MTSNANQIRFPFLGEPNLVSTEIGGNGGLGSFLRQPSGQGHCHGRATGLGSIPAVGTAFTTCKVTLIFGVYQTHHGVKKQSLTCNHFMIRDH